MTKKNQGDNPVSKRTFFDIWADMSYVFFQWTNGAISDAVYTKIHIWLLIELKRLAETIK